MFETKATDAPVNVPDVLRFEPLPAFASIAESDGPLAPCDGKRIGILIVTYNAVTTLKRVLARITPRVWQNVEEIAVFDDASQDATYELAVGLKTLNAFPKLHVLKHVKNLGYGGNQKAGYEYFIAKGFDIVVLLHGDGQYAPEILSHLYHPIVKGEASAVFGSRMMRTYGGPIKGGMPAYKYVGNRILTIFENRSLGLHLTEFHSGYRAYDLHALKKINFSKMTDDFHFDTEIIIKLQHQRLRIAEVPIPTYYGNEICYVNGFKYARDVFSAVRRYRQTCRSVERHPEFEEYFNHYPIKQSRGSSHAYAMGFVGSGQSVLDIGCGEGHMAEELQTAGNVVTGLDVLDRPAKPDSFEQYIACDLENGFVGSIGELRRRKFDRILLLDILEHLRRPEVILENCHPLLEAEGQIVVSLPNVANIHVRLMLLMGRFNYTERGILDRTHVHFYTRRTAKQLLVENGFEVVQEKMTAMPLELVLGLSPQNPFMRAINLCTRVLASVLPGVFGYQIMYVAKRKREERGIGKSPR
jgi:2-polyprenyl-3-methyl-5-hydroxy-6-metoxy-1,4-benzoquinol methylase